MVRRETTRSRRQPRSSAQARTAGQPRRRLAPEQRAAQILDAAAAFFADHGFAASTRDLAKRIGITQALIYRYYPSKAALVRRLLEASQADRWVEAASAAMAERGVKLADRLVQFYCAYVTQADGVSLRLWLRAALDGAPYPRRHADPLSGKVLAPVIDALRAALGLPSVAQLPILREERELSLSLQGAISFLRLRQHAYRVPAGDALRAMIALHVATVLPGVLAQIKAIHSNAGRRAQRRAHRRSPRAQAARILAESKRAPARAQLRAAV